MLLDQPEGSRFAHDQLLHQTSLERRSTLAWLDQVSRPLVEELAEIMGNLLGWAADQKKAEVKHALEVLKEFHGVVL